MLIASCLSGMRSMPAQPTTVWSRRSSPPPGLNGGWREARGRASTCVGRCFGLGGEPRGGRGCGGGMGGGGSKAAQMRARAFKCPPLEKTCAAPRAGLLPQLALPSSNTNTCRCSSKQQHQAGLLHQLTLPSSNRCITAPCWTSSSTHCHSMSIPASYPIAIAIPIPIAILYMYVVHLHISKQQHQAGLRVPQLTLPSTDPPIHVSCISKQ